MFTSLKINQRLNSKHMRERFIESNEHTVNTLRKCQHFAKRAVQTLAAVFQPMVRTSCPNLDCFWLFTSTDRQTNPPHSDRPRPTGKGNIPHIFCRGGFRPMQLTLISQSSMKAFMLLHPGSVEHSQPKHTSQGQWVCWQQERLL